MGIAFFEKWVWAKKKGIAPLSEYEARRKHMARQPYVAVCDESQATAVVDIAGEWVSVGFLDESGRNYLTFDFRVLEQGNIFLKTATHREFFDTSTQLVKSDRFNFEPDGKYFVELQEGSTTSTRTGQVPTQPLWAEFPEFGEYQALLQTERRLQYDA